MNEEYKKAYRKQGRLSSELARAIKKHESNIEYERQEIKVQDKVNTLEFYNTLSEAEKRVFDEKLKIKEIRDNYLLYLKYVHGEDYKITHFHALLGKLVQKVVEKVEKGEKVRLLISTPAQHGKSLLVTETLPSWFLGRNPDSRCIVTAYNADIAEKFGDRNRQKVKEHGKRVFDIEISDSQDNKTQWDLKNHKGGLYATGLNGSLTSNNGSLIIVDDPIKNEIEANNLSVREQIWANFSTSLMTRQQGKGNAIIVIQTRWHDDDLIGRILNSEIKDEWLYINIPCVWESGVDKFLHRKVGETLCPELGFDSKWAESMKKMLGARRWNALYQGVPFVEGGDIVKRDFLKFYTRANVPSVFEEITMSCDLSFGGTKTNNDPCGITIWGKVGGNHYLLDYTIKKMSFTETLERIRFYCGKYPFMRNKIIEAKANGNATIEMLNQEIGGFVPYDPKGLSKESRLQLCLPYLEAGNVWLPDESVDRNIEEQVQIILRFPKVAHEEIVDTMTQYLLNYQYRYSGKINTDSNFSRLAQAIRGLKI